mmetsp:Transcript_27015/g.47921  ORF Transcript_27015/g.47921 Transcript_27015/m.47921 type:complete len:244 (+) Transcript_27015:98-829(+)
MRFFSAALCEPDLHILQLSAPASFLDIPQDLHQDVPGLVVVDMQQDVLNHLPPIRPCPAARGPPPSCRRRLGKERCQEVAPYIPSISIHLCEFFQPFRCCAHCMLDERVRDDFHLCQLEDKVAYRISGRRMLCTSLDQRCQGVREIAGIDVISLPRLYPLLFLQVYHLFQHALHGLRISVVVLAFLFLGLQLGDTIPLILLFDLLPHLHFIRIHSHCIIELLCHHCQERWRNAFRHLDCKSSP